MKNINNNNKIVNTSDLFVLGLLILFVVATIVLCVNCPDELW